MYEYENNQRRERTTPAEQRSLLISHIGTVAHATGVRSPDISPNASDQEIARAIRDLVPVVEVRFRGTSVQLNDAAHLAQHGEYRRASDSLGEVARGIANWPKPRATPTVPAAKAEVANLYGVPASEAPAAVEARSSLRKPIESAYAAWLRSAEREVTPEVRALYVALHGHPPHGSAYSGDLATGGPYRRMTWFSGEAVPREWVQIAAVVGIGFPPEYPRTSTWGPEVERSRLLLLQTLDAMTANAYKLGDGVAAWWLLRARGVVDLITPTHGLDQQTATALRLLGVGRYAS